MNVALGYIYDIFDAFFDLVFNDLVIVPGVTVGWVAITCFIFSILLRSLLALPKSMPDMPSLGTLQRNFYRRFTGSRR